MRAENISDAMEKIDEELVIPVDEKRKKQLESGRRRPIWITAAAMAACVGIIAGTLAVRNVSGGGSIPSESGITTTSAPINSETARGTTAAQSGVSTEATDEAAPANAVTELARAVYPEMSPFSTIDMYENADGSYDYEEEKNMYDRYRADENARREAAKDLPESLSDFFGASLRQILSGADGENRVYSPVNLYMALAMLAETTDGESRQQILDLIGAEDIEALRAQAGNMWKAVYDNNNVAAVIPANSLWLSDRVNYRREPLDTLAKSYYASSFSGDTSSPEMTNALREWLNEQTGGLLEEAAQGAELSPDTLIALCSTLYFKAKWRCEFVESKNTVGIFHGAGGDTETVFMNGYAGGGSYYEGGNFKAASSRFEPYPGCSMLFVLPNEGVDIDEVLASGDYIDLILNKLSWEELQYPEIELSLPKFDVCSDTDLRKELEALGVTDIFDSGKADFSPLSDNADGAALGKIQHAARVVIDEHGCTAASFTSEMPGTGVPFGYVKLVFDRPFIFVVQSETGQPLFAGVVNMI